MISKAVVLVSGGLDSAVCLAYARKTEGREVYALSFDYGQRHRREIDYARRLAGTWQAKRHVVANIDLRVFGGSALTDMAIDVPKVPGGAPPETPLGPGIPVTYVPARNTIFLSYALAYAEVCGASDIFIGVNALDYSGYPDCRPGYIAAFEAMANLATKAAVEGASRLKIQTPLIAMNKAEIVRQGASLGLDFAQTWSCYDPGPDGKPCGHCDSCRLRAKGFREAGLTDPGAS